MIGIIATLSIQEGASADFELIATQLVEKVNTLEEGVLYYDLYKENDTTYIFLERYKDEEAQIFHGKTDYFKELGAKMGAFLTAAPHIKVLKSV
jgi:quinol monooxygenase YgiN